MTRDAWRISGQCGESDEQQSRLPVHDTNRIRNQIDSENETTLQIPLRGNAPGSRPLPDVRFLPRRHDGGDSESPAAPPRHRIRGTASAQRIHELHHPTERRERRPGGRMELSPGRELHPKPYRRRKHRLYGNGGTAGVWADRIIMLHCEGGRNSHRVSVNGTAVGSARDSGTPSEFELPNAVAGRTNTLRIELPADTDEPNRDSAAAGRPHLVFPLFPAAHPHLGL